MTHDPVRVERYVTKYASKGETKSGVIKSAFTEIFETTREGETDTCLALKRVMTKVLGSRDVSRAEALHCLQDIPLHDSNVTIVRCSLQSSKEVVSNEMDDIEYRDSLVDVYAIRRVFEKSTPKQ